jgi:hypothetical protein
MRFDMLHIYLSIENVSKPKFLMLLLQSFGFSWSMDQVCDRTTSGRGLSPGSTWAILGKENTINTYKYNTIYWISSRSYYNLGSRISYIEEIWSQNYASKDKSEFAEEISLNGQNILYVLKENAIHRCSKPKNPSTESNPHRQEEAVPHLHTKDSKSKAWATTLSKTYPRWPKDHL